MNRIFHPLWMALLLSPSVLSAGEGEFRLAPAAVPRTAVFGLAVAEPMLFEFRYSRPPENRAEQVENWLLEAQRFYEVGRYELALKRYEQVLNLDPLNREARDGEKRVRPLSTVTSRPLRRGDIMTPHERRLRILPAPGLRPLMQMPMR